MSIDTLECFQALQCVLWFVYKCACLRVYTHIYTHTPTEYILSFILPHHWKQRQSIMSKATFSRTGTALLAQSQPQPSLCVCSSVVSSPVIFWHKAEMAGPCLWVQAGI